jgi:hypothetical protein
MLSSMSDARISSRFLFLGIVYLAGAAIVIYAAVQFDDVMLMAAGGVAVLGAIAVVAYSFRSLLGFGVAPGVVARRAVGWKLKHFWMPAAETAAPRGAMAEQIDEAERELGVKLPAALVRVLRAQNGGEPRYSLWAPAQAPAHDCRHYHIDQLHDVERMVHVSRESIDERILPSGVVCICGFSDDDWQLCLDYRGVVAGAEPSVVAFDIEDNCYRLVDTFAAFVADLTRPLARYVYAPQGVLGKAVDGVLSNLAKALGVEWRPHLSEADVYVTEHGVWTSASGGPATFELRANVSPSGGKGSAPFPETWSYRILHCAIHPRYREELERCLSRTEYKWLLVHDPRASLPELGQAATTQGI